MNENLSRILIEFLKTSHCSKNLKRNISINELKTVVKRLKLRKAVGLDQISNEMMKYGFPFLKDPLLKLFSPILEAQIVPADWCKGLISPIFKLDDDMNPDNYKAVCVISCLSKLFFLILNDRLTCFLKANNTIDRSQIGF